MDDIQVIRKLSHALVVAEESDNWQQLERINGHVVPMLRLLAGTTISVAKREALLELQNKYRKVLASCHLKSKTLQQKMMLHRRNQEGIVAYTFFMDEKDIHR